MALTFSIETVVRGYHIYKEVWNAAMDGTELPCKREIGNAHDPFAIAIKKVTPTGNVTVGHTPRVISSVCSVFIRRGGTIVCVVNRARQYSSDLPQGGLEVPCILTFRASSEKEGKKAKKLIESALLVKIKASVLKDSTLSEAKASSPQYLEDSVAVNELQAASDVEPPQKRRKLNDADVERIIMGEELTDVHINTAQHLLKEQFPNLSGLQCTLLQAKETSKIDTKATNKILQIVHCLDRHHWIVATTIGSKKNEILIFDSIFRNIDSQTTQVLGNLFGCLPTPTFGVMNSQKQKGVKDCGLFAIAFATALAFGENPSNIKFCQESMRAHLINCLERDELIPFP